MIKQIFILLFFSLRAIAQSDDSESLLHIYQSYPDDTNKINLLYKEGFSLRTSNPKLAMQFAIACAESAKEFGDQKLIAKSFNLMGIMYYRKGKLNQALKFHQEALKIRLSIGDSTGSAKSRINIGNIYDDQGRKEEALHEYKEAEKIYVLQKNIKDLVVVMMNSGAVYLSEHIIDKAIPYFNSAIKFAEKLNDYEAMAICNNNIGICLEEQGKLNEAQEYYLESLKLRNLMDNTVEKADSYINLASISIKNSLFDTAYSYLKLSEQICIDNDYSSGLESTYRKFEEFFLAKKQMDSAYVYLKKLNLLQDQLKKQIVFPEAEDEDAISMKLNKQEAIGIVWLYIFCIGIALGLFGYLYLIKKR